MKKELTPELIAKKEEIENKIFSMNKHEFSKCLLEMINKIRNDPSYGRTDEYKIWDKATSKRLSVDRKILRDIKSNVPRDQRHLINIDKYFQENKSKFI